MLFVLKEVSEVVDEFIDVGRLWNQCCKSGPQNDRKRSNEVGPVLGVFIYTTRLDGFSCEKQLWSRGLAEIHLKGSFVKAGMEVVWEPRGLLGFIWKVYL